MEAVYKTFCAMFVNSSWDMDSAGIQQLIYITDFLKPLGVFQIFQKMMTKIRREKNLVCQNFELEIDQGTRTKKKIKFYKNKIKTK